MHVATIDVGSNAIRMLIARINGGGRTKILKKYRVPIYVTENGIADSADARRGNYITSYIMAMQKAMAQGVDIRGYFYWSLFDNFEWALGFEKRFGLVAIDYNTLQRTVRSSAHRYKEIIEKNEV